MMPLSTKQALGSCGLFGQFKKERRALYEQLKASSMSRAEKKAAMDKINIEGLSIFSSVLIEEKYQFWVSISTIDMSDNIKSVQSDWL